MKSYPAISTAQKKLCAAVFGISFAVPVFFCQGNTLFPPLGNEFHSFLFIAAGFMVYSLSFLGCPGRKKTYFVPVQFLFAAALLVLLYMAVWKKTVVWARILILLAEAGWISGLLRDRICKTVRFPLLCCGGMLAGATGCWFHSLHPGSIPFSVLFFAALAILLWTAVRLIRHWPDLSAAGRVLLMLLWLLLTLRAVSAVQLERLGPAEEHGKGNASFRPALLAEAGLQPDRKDLKILLIGDDPQLREMLGDFLLVRKLAILSPRSGYDPYRMLHLLAEDFDLILLQAPLPESFFAERFYRLRFYRHLKDHLQEHGVLAVWFPEEALPCRKKYVLDLYGSAGAVLKQVFPVIKPAGLGPLMLLCGGENITNSPAELDRRAKKLLADPAGFPEGVFLMRTPEEIREQEEVFSAAVRRQSATGTRERQGSLMWNCLLSHPAVDRSGTALLLDVLRDNLLYVLCGFVFQLAVIRYFNSGALEKKRTWLTVENGFFTGLVLILLLIPFQQSSGRLCSDFQALSALLLFLFFCGLLSQTGGKRSALLLKIMCGSTLLLPLCALAFLHGYTVEPVLFYLLAGYTVYTAGVLCGAIRSEVPALTLGIALGLISGTVLFWLPGGTVFAAVLAILLRIPPVAAENLRKQFDKCKRKYNIYCRSYSDGC